MRPLADLLDTSDPAIEQIREWVAAAANDCLLLPPSPQRDDILVRTQLTTHSTLGAIIYETGGILIDGGWLRFIGSGHSRFTRNIPDWNSSRADKFLLVADDAVGGFFAVNGGAFGDDLKNIYYWAPDSLEWEPLNIGFTDFFVWTISDRVAQFYQTLRWPTWRADTQRISADQAFAFFPFLFTKEGSIDRSDRRAIPVAEIYDVKRDLLAQLG